MYGFLGATAYVLVTHFNVEIHAPEIDVNHKENGTIPLGLVGLTGRVSPIPWLALTVKVSGFPGNR